MVWFHFLDLYALSLLKMILAERSGKTQAPLQKGGHLGIPDLVSREYFQDPGRLADLLNAELFQGERRIRQEDIRQRDPSEIRNLTEDTAVCASLVTRDYRGEIQIGLQVVLLALELQTGVSYIMPLRVLNYESAGYESQWRQIRDSHQKKGDLSSAEYLSGFRKEDRLAPILTLVVYFGQEPWDGPRTLKEMLDLRECPPEVARQIADYPMRLIEVREYPRLERFHSDLRYVFGFLQRDRRKEELYQYVMENRAVFSHLDGVAYQMIQVMSHSSKLWKSREVYENEEGEIDMCQALLDMREECISIGQEKGREEGISIGKQRTKQVFRLFMAGKSEKEIAGICEISVKEVREILS